MATLDNFKQAELVVDHYKKEYEAKFKTKSILNRNKLKYLVIEVLKDLSVSEFNQLVTYYVKVDSDPSLTVLCYEYDSLLVDMHRDATDATARAQLRRETAERVRQFRQRYGAK